MAGSDIIFFPPEKPQPTYNYSRHPAIGCRKAKVEKLGMMKEAGLITEEEFAAMRAELLKNIL